ncbi:hypothetical protein B0H34DRAFT_733802 [Crassisporium funariophilum]|nr:hypothetical protein B0H34DRAFT_733802 [Crassisporium funariophilum]
MWENLQGSSETSSPSATNGTEAALPKLRLTAGPCPSISSPASAHSQISQPTNGERQVNIIA